MTTHRWRPAYGRRGGRRMAARLSHVALAVGALSTYFPVHAAGNCESLVTASLPEAAVTSATTVPGPSFVGPDGRTYQELPAFCRVAITATPTSDSLINIELWMPRNTWNGSFEGTGNGGYAGSLAVSTPAMVAGLKAGFAVTGTDMGTTPSTNNDADALVGHPEKWVDFGSRSTHLMTTLSKQVVDIFYGHAPRYSYFNGCSTGGQQALMEAQAFPTDYDGILGGDPASNRTHVHASLVWNYAALHGKADSLFTSQQAQAVTDAVITACAVKSGGLASDPFLTDPRFCDWDPAELQCGSTTSTSCLSADQVAAARAIYAGATDPANGHLIFPGTVRGSESDPQFGWVGVESNPEPPFDSLFKWAFGTAWAWQSYDFDQDMAFVDSLLAPMLNANSPDLSQFQNHGGKLMMYHGWDDPLVSPQDSIDYYLRVIAAQSNSSVHGLTKTQAFYRLFMVPGMYHCAFGPGPNAFGNRFSGQVVAPPPPVEDAQHDAFIALQKWVEKGRTPDELIATKYVDDQPDLGVQMTRPICAYPKVPRYSGSGDPNVAGSFNCVEDGNTNNPMPAPEYLK